MSNINFRKTNKSYSADYQRKDGFGLERRFFRAADVNDLARHYGWEFADETLAEALIVQQVVTPYRVVSL